MRPVRLISGGQTGVDRAGLDVAIDLGLPWGGYAPRGWIDENGGIAGKYRLGHHANGLLRQPGSGLIVPGPVVLGETSGGQPWRDRYIERTKLNVEACNACLVFYWDRPTPGSNLTIELCKKAKKPVWALRITDTRGPFGLVTSIQAFLRNWCNVLMIAGTRGSKAPGIHAYTYTILREALTPLVVERQAA